MKRLLAVLVLPLWASACCQCKNPTSPAVPTATAVPTPTAAPTSTPTVVPANSPPVLGIDVSPVQGTHPLSVLANMCMCSDADHDALFYEFHWGDGNNGGSTFCRRVHDYTAAGTYQAYFCVSDHKAES